jgi:hypothetical protein
VEQAQGSRVGGEASRRERARAEQADAPRLGAEVDGVDQQDGVGLVAEDRLQVVLRGDAGIDDARHPALLQLLGSGAPGAVVAGETVSDGDHTDPSQDVALQPREVVHQPTSAVLRRHFGHWTRRRCVRRASRSSSGS